MGISRNSNRFERSSIIEPICSLIWNPRILSTYSWSESALVIAIAKEKWVSEWLIPKFLLKYSGLQMTHLLWNLVESNWVLSLRLNSTRIRCRTRVLMWETMNVDSSKRTKRLSWRSLCESQFPMIWISEKHLGLNLLLLIWGLILLSTVNPQNSQTNALSREPQTIHSYKEE